MSYARFLACFALAAGCAPEKQLSPMPHGDMAQAPSVDMATAPSNQPDLADPTQPQPDLANSGPVITTLNIHYPAGSHSMALRGDSAGLDWMKGVALTSPDAKVFTYTWTSLAAEVQFKPLLDDTSWSHGDNYKIKPGQTLDVYPHFTATQGTVKKLFTSFSSAVLNYNQVVWVYLPPSYDENTLARYPVLYMHDGQNLFNPPPPGSIVPDEWHVDESMNTAAESQPAPKSIPEVIVIGPECGPDRNNIYTPVADPSEGFGGKGDLYLTMLKTELKPQVDAMLRTMPEREHTGILGSSLGGLISAWAGCKYSDTFGLVGIMSPSTWWNNEWITGEVMKMQSTPRPVRVYLDSGDSGNSNDDVTQTAKLAGAFRGLGYKDAVNFDYQVQMGAQHSEIYWSQRFPDAASFLFGPR